MSNQTITQLTLHEKPILTWQSSEAIQWNETKLAWWNNAKNNLQKMQKSYEHSYGHIYLDTDKRVILAFYQTTFYSHCWV